MHFTKLLTYGNMERRNFIQYILIGGQFQLWVCMLQVQNQIKKASLCHIVFVFL
jgi:hypothetical protein